MRKLLLCLSLIMGSLIAVAQTTVNGTITDSETGEALIGATILEKGTNNGTITDINGAFSLNVSSGATLVISYIGFETMEMSADADLSSISLQSGSIGLDEVLVIASYGVDRKTPVAMSNIKADVIEAKIGSQEFPEILKSTPGVFATREGGGWGDGRIAVRGFNSENVAVLINGIPVNDMENGRVFWSNWAGLTDATHTVQVQRGLGAVKVAVPSIGGTINIVSKASERNEGGSFTLMSGNDSFQKVGFELSSGLTDDGWAFTIAGSRTEGNGFVDGTEFLGHSYFATIAKKINDSHEVTFTAIGAKQRHGQRQTQHNLGTFENSPRGIKHNSNWGFLNGQRLSVEDNFYHKPQLSLNHYWTINDGMELSTALYGSWGTGGGGGAIGSNRGKLEGNVDGYNFPDGTINLQRIYDENVALGGLGSDAVMRASRNDHNWYGLLSTLRYELSDKLTLIGGLDWRNYRGQHFREVTNLLGGQFYLDDDNVNNPINAARVGDKIDYHNDGIVKWLGFFGQLEYSQDALSAFVSLSASNTGYDREDFFNYLDSDPQQKVGTFNFFGYMVKGGANYNLNTNWNVFANVGYFEKAPGFDAVFPNFDNEDPNSSAENQKIFSNEIGLGYRSTRFSANLNFYRTEWRDRTFTDSFQFTRDAGLPTEEDVTLTANFLGVDALHQGIEIDFVYKPSTVLQISGMLSVGDWTWQNNLTDVGVFDEGNPTPIATVDAFIAGLQVGDAAQTTAAIGIAYNLMPNLRFSADFNYYDNLYADFDPTDRSHPTAEGVDAWKAPAYGLLDLNLKYDFELAGLDASFIGNVFNVGDVEYIADVQDGGSVISDVYVGGTAQNSQFFYGAGVTWTAGVKVRF